MSTPIFYPTTPFTGSGSPILPPLNKMSPGQNLTSPNGRFVLAVQEDSNMVLYDNGSPAWVVGPGGPYTGYTPYAEDHSGTFLITQYYVFFNDPVNKRTWQTTNSSPFGNDVKLAYFRTYLSLQDDGNLVLNDTLPLWSSNKSIEQFSVFSTDLLIKPGETFVPGQRKESGTNFLQFQADGNLVLYNEQKVPIWNTGTGGTGANLAAMQEDGNFVIYAGSTPVWNTKTGGNPDAYLRIQSNGTVSVAIDKPVWARFGFTPTITPRKKWTKWGPYDLPSWPFTYP